MATAKRIFFGTQSGSEYELAENDMGVWWARQLKRSGSCESARVSPEWRRLAVEPVVRPGFSCFLAWDSASTPLLPETNPELQGVAMPATETTPVDWVNR